MSYIIDRRLNGKNKSAVNRSRFLKRYKSHVKKAIEHAISERSITDMDSGETVTIPKDDISEPRFNHGAGGKRQIVNPGNHEYVQGDRIDKPKGGQGGGSGEGQASNEGEGEDGFMFEITQEEFLEYMFDDLELPNLLKKKISNIETSSYDHAGIVTHGVPAKINILRTMRQATARRMALASAPKRKLKEVEAEIAALMDDEQSVERNGRLVELKEVADKLRKRIDKVPFIDTFDLRYNHHEQKPKPTSQAVMFCLMDVSGSMNQSMKDIAKRFFYLLYLFLNKNYKKIELVFIRHHTSAKEVDERDFFYSRETGGTIVSSALLLAESIMQARYSPSEWNIYMAQASDGDNWNDDSPYCGEILRERILPYVQYFSYVEIMARHHQAMWNEYQLLQEEFPESFAMQDIAEPGDIYPVFRKLFEKKAA